MSLEGGEDISPKKRLDTFYFILFFVSTKIDYPYLENWHWHISVIILVLEYKRNILPILIARIRLNRKR